MKDQTINRLKIIQENIEKSNPISRPNIICVSKTFPISKLEPLIKYGHHHYGENKVQEAEKKWGEILKLNTKIKIHTVGKLQSNKAKNNTSDATDAKLVSDMEGNPFEESA